MASKLVTALAFAAGLALAYGATPAHSQTVDTGSGPIKQMTSSVPAAKIVSVKNPDGVTYYPKLAGERLFDFNEECELQKHGTLGFMAALDEKTYLVKYLGGKRVEGLSCPEGTLIVMPKMEYEQMSAEYQALFLAEEAEKERIRSILAGIFTRPR